VTLVQPNVRWYRDLRLPLLLAIALYYAARWRSVDAFVVAMDHCGQLFCDFVRYYYPMSQQIRTSAGPIEGYLYPPLLAILLAPIGAQPLQVALWAWGVCQVLLGIGLCVLPSRALFSASRNGRLVYAFVFATAVPVLNNFKWGQVSVLVTLAVVAALSVCEERAPWGAALLALAIAIKSYCAIFVVYFLLKRDWRFVAWTAAFLMVGLGLIPVLVMGRPQTVEFYEALGALFAGAQPWTLADPNTQFFANVVGRLLGLSAERMGAVYPALRAAGVAVVALNVAVLARIVARRVEHRNWWALTLLFLSLPFVVNTSWPHYFVYLPFAQAFLFDRIMRDPTPRPAVAAKLGVLLLPSVVLSSIFFFNLVGHWIVYNRAGSLFFANAILLILALIEAPGARVAALPLQPSQ
jgi:glycosyl transferase family 87